jgi:multidrug efflux pump subunit AcrA (membrane-fusion protein)
MFKKILQFIGRHKIISGLVLIVLIVGGYFWYASSQSTTTVTKYVVENATMGTVDTSVSGSGQVESGTTVDIKPNVSENVTKIYVKVGDHVSAGQVLVQLDATNEERSLKQAELSLQSAQLSLSKLTEAPATTTLLQDQNSVTQAEQNIVTASSTLQKDYQSGFGTVSGAFVDFQTVMAGLKSFVTGNDISKSQNDPDAYVNIMPNYLTAAALPYRDAVLSSYTAASAAYQQNLIDYHAASLSSDPATLDALFSETYDTNRAISESVKSIKDLLNYVVNNYPTGSGSGLPTITTTFQSNMSGYTNTVSSDGSSLANIASTISSDKTDITNDRLSLNEASSSLATLVAGADALDVQSSQLSIQQQELALETAQTQLADTSITAPISGVVSVIDAVVGETAPSPAVTLVGDGELASVTLDESDAINVAVGDPATLTFDAVDGLSLAGTVTQVDPVGTVSSGVVSYTEEIGFTNSSSTVSIKPGMSVTADIVTKVHQNVITVPSTALVTMGSSTYILEPSVSLSASEIASSTNEGIVLTSEPKRVLVTTGLVGDSDTEILSGVSEGDQIITKTIKSSSATTATAAATKTTSATKSSSALQLLGGSSGGRSGYSGGGGAPPGL